MIIHYMKKLAGKLPEVSSEPLDEASPLGSWHANIYTIDHRNCILFCHDQTRFVLFMAGLKKEHFANLNALFQDMYCQYTTKTGL